ncbi:MAG: hypothetical protein RLO12_10890 [Fulvivirga sp.]
MLNIYKLNFLKYKMYKVLYLAGVLVMLSTFRINAQDEIKFSVDVNKDSVIVSEPFVITVSLKLFNGFNSNVRFINLPKQLSEYRNKIIQNYEYVLDTWITNIDELYVLDGEDSHKQYPLLKISIYPSKSGHYIIPQLDLTLAEVDSIGRDVAEVHLRSEERKIVVNEKELSGIYENEFYRMVGEFNLYTKPSLFKRANVNENVSFELEIKGDGMTYPISKPLIENNEFYNVQYSESIFRDTIVNNDILGSKLFKCQIVFKKPGEYSLNDMLNLSFYSPQSDLISKPKSKFKFYIGEKDTENIKYQESPKITKDSVLIGLDFSQSMLIEDYLPNRLSRVLNIMHQLDGNNLFPIFLYAGETKWIKNLNDVDFNKINLKKGTAIGDAIWSCLEVFKDANTNNGRIILIGDGDNTAGSISTTYAANLAKKYGIKIYRILSLFRMLNCAKPEIRLALRTIRVFRLLG